MPSLQPHAIAFAPTVAMGSSPDIPTPTVDLLKLSPIPIGLQISSVDKDGKNPKPIPLFYVSKAAAALRDPKSHPRNGPGVVPGWYACASEGRFVIDLIPISDFFSHFKFPVAAFVYVNREKHYAVSSWKPGMLRIGTYVGTLDNWETRAGVKDGRRLCMYEPLMIKKVTSDEEHGASMGCISMKVGSCQSYSTYQPSIHQHKDHHSQKGTPSSNSAKSDIKAGRTLSIVRGDGVVRESTKPCVSIVGFQEFFKDNVSIRIYEEWWLRSRRIIDDDGNSVSAAMFKILRRLDCGPRVTDVIDLNTPNFGPTVHTAVQVVDVDAIEPPPTKKLKTTPGEKIDLTDDCAKSRESGSDL